MRFDALTAFLSEQSSVVEVLLNEVRGSSPREAGAALYVSQDAMCGTIGGGQLEYMAIDEARRMLRQGKQKAEMKVPLGPEIGQCCGGNVCLSLTLVSRQHKTRILERIRDEDKTQPQVLIFGAGHVGRALAKALEPLPVRAKLIDSRAEELALCKAEIPTILTPLPETVVQYAPAGTAFVVVTHDHSLDFLVANAALARKDAAYVGMIGSATKRTMFRRFLEDQNPENCSGFMSQLTCPIGALTDSKLSDKRPEVIAAMVAAELLVALDDQGLTAGLSDNLVIFD